MNTARRAIANGFLPDIISSDLSTITKLARLFTPYHGFYRNI